MPDLDFRERDLDTGEGAEDQKPEILGADEIGAYTAFDWTPEPIYTSTDVITFDEFETDSDRDLSVLSEDARKALLTLDDIVAKSDIAPRRIEIIQAWKANHYDRGYQFLLPLRNGGWTLPGTTSAYNATMQKTIASLYHTNVYGEKGEIIVAALSRQVPPVEFFPANPSHPPDEEMADVAQDLKEIWAKNNDLMALLQSVAKIFWNEDRALLWTRYELNGEEYGYEDPEEPTVPEDELTPPTEPLDTQASAEYESQNESVVPETAPRRPRGRVITTAHGKLDHKVPIYVDCLGKMCAVSISEDKDESTAKAQFPWMKDQVRGGGDGTGESELDRIARENVRQAVPGSYVTGDAINRHCVVKHTWIRRQMFYDAQVSETAREELLSKFPDGVLVVKAATEFCFARNECIDDHLSIGHPFPGKGQNRRALGESLLPIQDYINELVMLTLDFAKRTVPKKWMDAEVFDIEAIKNQTNIPGTVGPFQRPPNTPVEQLIFVEPTPTPQPWLVDIVKWIITALSEQISGALPSLFGAQISGQVGSEGVAIQRDQALQRVGCPWNSIQSLFANAARQAVTLTAKCTNRDITDVIPGKGPISVRLNQMRGSVLCYPESNPEFPESQSQKEQRLMQVLDFALKSPDSAAGAMVLDPQNLKLFRDGLRLKGFVIKGANSVQKQEAEMEILLRGAPLPNPQKVQLQQIVQQAQSGMQEGAMRLATGVAAPEEADQLQQAQQFVSQLSQQLQSMPDEISSIPVRGDGSEDDSAEAGFLFNWMNGPTGRKFANGSSQQKAAFANALLHWTEHTASAQKLAQQQAQPGKAPSESFTANVKDMPPTVAVQMLEKLGIHATLDDFQQHAEQEFNVDVAKKVIPKTVEHKEPPKPPQPGQSGPPQPPK